MNILYRGRRFIFRPVDVDGLSEEDLLALADSVGMVMFDPYNSNYYLYIEGVGYGIEDVDY